MSVPHYAKNRVLQNLQQISDYLVSRIKEGYQVTFGGFMVWLSISGKFEAMNADGKSYQGESSQISMTNSRSSVI